MPGTAARWPLEPIQRQTIVIVVFWAYWPSASSVRTWSLRRFHASVRSRRLAATICLVRWIPRADLLGVLLPCGRYERFCGVIGIHVPAKGHRRALRLCLARSFAPVLFWGFCYSDTLGGMVSQTEAEYRTVRPHPVQHDAKPAGDRNDGALHSAPLRNPHAPGSQPRVL